jgi:hypothetical protein
VISLCEETAMALVEVAGLIAFGAILSLEHHVGLFHMPPEEHPWWRHRTLQGVVMRDAA